MQNFKKNLTPHIIGMAMLVIFFIALYQQITYRYDIYENNKLTIPNVRIIDDKGSYIVVQNEQGEIVTVSRLNIKIIKK
jgi:hypothetical protein